MKISETFSIEQPAQWWLSEENNWTIFSHYFMFLTLKNGGCSKTDSGSLNITFPSHWEKSMEITATLGGYDSKTLPRSHYVVDSSEKNLKIKLIDLFEKERLAILNDSEETF